jgi:hypothetical protein
MPKWKLEVKLSYLPLLSALLPALCATAAVAVPEAQSAAENEPDIARVISVEEETPHPLAPPVCEVIDVKMTYLDSSGQTRTHTYRKLAPACSRS